MVGRVRRNLLRLGYRRIVQLLVFLVIVPTTLILALGIVLMFLGRTVNLLFGVLTVSFVLVVVTGVVLVLVFLRRQADLSELQADFVSKVSHELRTPLTSIRLFAETMQRARSDRPTLDRCLEALQRDIERLLDWGRMEAGRKQFEMRDEKVAAVVSAAVEAFAPICAHHPQLDFAAEVEPDLPIVRVDRAAMVDAIGNLLSNAFKYGGSPPVVRLRACRLPTGVGIEVTDNGQGIPHVEQRRIFDKFYRIDDRLSRQREGNGLGLAIVRYIVRAHKGRIQVDSALGSGSTFRIVLLAASVESAARPAAAQAEGT
jgi:two-component system phosphate regulon sensor histidine kinase PhoR